MPLDVSGVVTGDVIQAIHVSQFYSLLTGAMTDQAVTLKNQVTVGGNQGIGQVPLTVQGVSGQTSDLFDVKQFGGSIAFGISAAGTITFGGALTVNSGGITVTGASTFVSGGVTITAGGLVVSAGGANISGDLTLTGSGNIVMSGVGITMQGANPGLFFNGAQTIGISYNAGTGVMNSFGAGFQFFAGPVSIVAGTAPNVGLNIAGQVTTTGAGQYGLQVAPTFPATATSEGSAITAQVVTTNTSFTMAVAAGLHVQNPNRGAASAITTAYGILIENQTAGGTNYGLYLNGATNNAFVGGALTVSGNANISSFLGVGTAPVTNAGIVVASSLVASAMYGIQVAPTFSMATGNAVGVIITANSNAGGSNSKYGVYVDTQSGANAANIGLFIAAPTGGTVNIGAEIGGGILLTTTSNPTSAAGQLGMSAFTTNSASAGGVATPPATVAGYLVWHGGGSVIKIPFYSN